MKRIFLPVLLGLILLSNAAKAQQAPLMSQYMFNMLYLNPAYAGYKGDPYVHTFFRSQWVGMSGAPQTFAIGADMGILDEQVGLGLTFSADRNGATNTYTLLSDYSYWLKLNNDGLRLSFGLSAGVVNYSIDGTELDPIEQYDPSVAKALYNVWLPEAGAGAYLSNNRFYLGLSGLNLLSRYLPIKNDEKERFIVRNYTQLALAAGVLFPISDNLNLKPSLLLKEDFNSPMSVDLNMMLFLYETVWVGFTYRTSTTYFKDYTEVPAYQSSALTFLLDVYVTEDLRIGYSFDYDFGELSRFSGGNHEVSLGYKIPTSSRGRKIQKQRHF